MGRVVTFGGAMAGPGGAGMGGSSLAAAARGVCPVLATPFDETGAIDVDGFGQLVGRVLDSGVNWVMWPGFASESYKLSDSEVAAMRACLLEQAHGRRRQAVISVARHATRLAVDDAVAAAEEGADAISLLPPYLLSPSRYAVTEHLGAVMSAVAPLPVIVQYAPALAPSPIRTADLTRLAAEQQNFRMVKIDSASAGPMISELLGEEPALESVVGYAGIAMIDALRQGARGIQPGCSFVEVYQRIWQLWDAGRADEATRLHGRLLPYVTSWMADMELIISVEKNISKQRGWIGSDYCRAPGRRLTPTDHAFIFRFLDEFACLLRPLSNAAGR